MKRIVIDALSNNVRTALCKDGELIEFIAEDKSSKIGNIYLGTVKKILPSKFAFVDVGLEKNTFMQLSDKKQESLYKYNELTGKYNLKIREGDNVIVQIEKEGTELKGAVVSANLSFAGKYVVLIANQNGIGISKKIQNTELKKLLKKTAEDILPDGYALIMRTNCENTDIEYIKEEIKLLYEKSKSIIEKGKYIKSPSLLYEAENETEKIIRDFITNDEDEIVINEKNILNKFDINKYKNNIILYDNDVPIFDFFGIQSQLEKAFNNKIWLKSGGFIIIDEVEACTVIDVNSGKFISKDHRKTVLKTNIEASVEIAKQIRLRNLSGIIIIDFIDMANTKDRDEVIKCLEEAVKKDRITTTVVGMTELGLMQLTRKKTRISLTKALTNICPYCKGIGRTENEAYIADRIKDKVCSIFAGTIYDLVTISSNKRIIEAFKGENNEYLMLEKKFGKKIKLNIISTQKLDYFEIEKEKIK